jgi:predicted N-acetyltransferase YhbS
MSEDWTIRPATPSDTAGCGRVIFEAFGAVSARHGFESRWPSADFASEFIREFASLDGIYSVVCEHEGSVIGCNFLDERGDVRGIGPTAVAPSAQGSGVERALMANVLERAGNGKSVRLLQDSFNMGSMSLYASLGFEVREPVILMRGKPSEGPGTLFGVRPIREGDLEACSRLCHAVHGFDRERELSDALRLEGRIPLLRVRDGLIVAYTSGFGTFGHAVAVSDEDMRSMICAVSRSGQDEIELLLPTRYSKFLQWCLGRGMTAVKPMTLMTRGGYAEPRGLWVPSVLY